MYVGLALPQCHWEYSFETIEDSGVDVMLTIFCFLPIFGEKKIFTNFRRKKLVFF
jgi:hypothetical protein